MDRPIIIYGKNGQLGTALAELLQDKAIVFGSSEYDFSDLENIKIVLKDINPKAIINATAYTDVNKAESEEDAAYKANVLIAESLATYCKEVDIPFVHYSTDYVFPGVGDKPHIENDATLPLNMYGKTKLIGEQKVSALGGKYLIFRTSWVYNHSHKNFFTTMLKLGAESGALSIVGDQFGAPTYAPHLAKATLEILNAVDSRNEFSSGIYHLCNAGCTSWHGFASAIFEEGRAVAIPLKIQEIKAISAYEFPTPAKRPQNSRLDCSRAFKEFGVKLPDWKIGLKECMAKLKQS